MRSALLLLGLLPVVVHTGPGEPYRWSDPPAAVADGNREPQGRLADVPAGRDRLPAVEVWTPDLQATLSLHDTRLREAERTSVTVSITPRSTAGLGPLPRGTVPDGNVHDVRVGEAVGGTLVLATPHEATGARFSADGRSWRALPVLERTGTSVEVAFRGSGLYLAVADHGPEEAIAPAPAPVAGTSGGVPAWVAAVVLAAALAAIVTVATTRSSSSSGGG